MQKIILATAILIVAGTAPYQAMRASRLKHEVDLVSQRKESGKLAKQRLLQQYRAATNQFAEFQKESEDLQSQTVGLHKLRSQAARARTDLAEAKATGENSRMEDVALDTWTSRVEALEQWLDQQPGQRIPEFKYLTDENWLDVVRDTDVEDEDDLRFAARGLRDRATGTFASKLARALDAYLRDHKDEFPKTVGDLQAYFDHPVEAAMLDRYIMLQRGRYDPEKPKTFLIGEKAPVDNDRIRKMIQRNDWFNESWEKIDPKK